MEKLSVLRDCVASCRRWLVRGLLAGGSVIVFTLSPEVTAEAQASETRAAIRIANDYGPTTLMGGLIEEYRQRVTILSNDTLSFSTRSDIPPQSHLPAMQAKVIEMASTLASALSRDDPMFALSTLPGITRTLEEAQRLYRLSRPVYGELLAARNQRLLFAVPWPPSGIWSRKPIDSLEALKGLNIRTFDTNASRYFLDLGAEPHLLSWEVLQARLGDDDLDAVLTSASGGIVLGLEEAFAHYTPINYAYPLNIVSINQEALDSLSAKQQKALLNVADEMERLGWQKSRASEISAYEELMAIGVTVQVRHAKALNSAMAASSQRMLQQWLQKVGWEYRDLVNYYLASRDESDG
ncbi:TRAP transporter substrate-binding protein DctP [Cobetia marina]|uniref:TRAP transporter substrate-binding protein DctP n=1 Tax=Cobetia marina TaxID=28258 RepID=UPI00174B0B59